MKSENIFFTLSADQALESLGARREGLLKPEIKRRQEEYGKNAIVHTQRLGRMRIFLRQFQSPLIIILLVAGAITILLQDYKDAAFILSAAFVNAILGFYQENKAEEALQALSRYVSERVLVLREGREYEIDSVDLVPGDIIRLEQGNKVPADAKILFENDLKLDEALLTGEALAQEKSSKADAAETVLADRKSMLYSGTTLVQGRARAVVTAIGSQTEFGKIAQLVSSQRREGTPLQKALGKLSMKIGYAVILITGGLFLLSYSSGTPILESFLISVALLVATVPEGLPIVMTVILAVGVQRLAKKNGIVRRLSAAETLGSTSIILTDKTGTLTQARMSLAQVHGIDGLSKEAVLSAALFNTDVVIENPQAEPTVWTLVGKPLETSLVRQAALLHQIYLPDIEKREKIEDFLPFNSKNKFSAALYRSDLKALESLKTDPESRFLGVLGAPEILLERSALSKDQREELLQRVSEMTHSGQRVIALGLREIKSGESLSLKEEAAVSDLQHFGLLGFEDPLRLGVKDAFERVTRAGVRTIIVTGDHSGTAISVAQELGMKLEADSLLEGRALDAMSEQELQERLEGLVVVSRVSPQGKMRLTQAFQEQGFVVAMSGDGVNDAPALKQADIGVAVGTGTDVAKGVADLVLLDDNFETLVEAIHEGRGILSNIRKAIVYLGSAALDGVLVIGGALMMGLALPMNALQILWVNLFTDSFPGIAFAFEPRRDFGAKPASLKQGIFTRQMKFLLLVNGIVGGVLVLLLYVLLLRFGVEESLSRTVTYAAFASYSLFLAFAVRSLRKSLFRYNPFSNKAMNLSVLLGLAMIALSVYLPALQNLFDTTALSPFWVAVVLVFGFFNILLIEATKVIFPERE